MNKTTIPAIVTSLLLISPIATATQWSIYGSADLSIDAIDDGQASDTTIASNSSYIGVAGNYQFTETVSAIFQYESGVDLTFRGHNDGNAPINNQLFINDNKHGRFFTQNRTSFIGVNGDFGQFKVGNLAASDQWINDYNLFKNKVGDLGNFWAATGLASRIDSAISYQSPKFSDIELAVTYQPNHSQLLAKANYNSERLRIGVAIADMTQKGATNSQQVIAITTSYQLDYFSFGAGLQSEFDVAGIANNDRDSLFFGATISITKRAKFKLQFANSIGSGVDKDATMFAIGYDYNLNKNTQFYVAYTHTNNGYNIAFSTNGKGHGQKAFPSLGDSPSSLSFGIIYNFDLKKPKE